MKTWYKLDEQAGTHTPRELIAELEQSVGQMEDNDLERIIFMCWAEQQSRCSSQQECLKEGE